MNTIIEFKKTLNHIHDSIILHKEQFLNEEEIEKYNKPTVCRLMEEREKTFISEINRRIKLIQLLVNILRDKINEDTLNYTNEELIKEIENQTIPYKEKQEIMDLLKSNECS